MKLSLKCVSDKLQLVIPIEKMNAIRLVPMAFIFIC